MDRHVGVRLLTVLVTRDADDAAGTADRLRRSGWGVAVAPLIVRRVDDGALSAALQRTPSPDLLLLTSAFAARAVARLAGPGFAPRRVACVGPATAEVARAAGLRVDLVPAESTGAALVAALGDLTAHVVLYPRAADALPATREALVRAGAHVDDVVAYTTIAATDGAAALAAAGPVDLVLLASPSTVRAYVAARAGAPAHGAPLVVPIGPTTAEACRAAGLAQADDTTTAAVRAALRG